VEKLSAHILRPNAKGRRPKRWEDGSKTLFEILGLIAECAGFSLIFPTATPAMFLLLFFNSPKEWFP
jgi:hypothetical protein